LLNRGCRALLVLRRPLRHLMGLGSSAQILELSATPRWDIFVIWAIAAHGGDMRDPV
jgi:hypothetical protein